MIRFILDTDHISLYQRENIVLRERIEAIPQGQIAVTIISFGEQVQGWLAQIHHAREDRAKVVRGYQWLQETLDYFAEMQILPFDEAAAEEFRRLRWQRVRIGTQDLRIAAIALANGCIVITRNHRDFERVPGLAAEDWTISPA